MPELPEVETVRRGLAPVMVGARLTTVEQRRANLRFPFPKDFVTQLEGCRVQALGRRAKYLIADLSTGQTLVMHLGMSGRFTIGAAEETKINAKTPGEFHHDSATAAKHDHVVFHFDNCARVTFNDPRRFGFMTLIESSRLDVHPLLAKLGVEPLGNAMHAHYIAARAFGRRTSLKAFLLDQRHIAGLGNIYVCEALYRAGLSPLRTAACLARKGALPTKGAERLVGAIRDVLNEAIAAGGSSLRDYAQTDGSLGYFQHAFAVYDREGEKCTKAGCRGRVKRVVQSGRSSFYCSQCQR